MSQTRVNTLHRLARPVIRGLISVALSIFSKVEITGQENIKQGEPLLLTANHFSHVDPLLVIHASPRVVEFWGGLNLPHVPPILRALPRLWGFYPVNRGGVSRDAVLAARNVLAQGGVFGVFPEAGAWANVLRPAREGAALLAAQTGVHVIPIGIYGADKVLENMAHPWVRPPVQVRIGAPIGPFSTENIRQVSREDLENISAEIMRAIAALLPPNCHGVYSEDPALREAAQDVAQYPWETTREMEVTNRTPWNR
jgi:1-acyl-sn-glycerol-3-phosphate acyltransferase